MSDYIRGDKELIAKLARLKATEARKAIRKGTREGCKDIQRAARDKAPKGRTGELRRGIKVRALPRSRKWTGTEVKLTVPYGGFLEYGLTHRHLEARHYLHDAVDATKDAAAAKALDIIRRQIEEATRA